MALGSFISDLVGPSVSTYLTPALEGAATGAIGNLVSGGDPLKGALVGGVTGAGIGAFGGENGALAQALGLSGSQANALIGALGGGGGYYLTGQNPLVGALLGGAGGYLYDGKPSALRGTDNSAYETGGDLKAGGPGNGWTDTATGQPVDPNTLIDRGGGGGPLGALASKLAGGSSGAGGEGGISKTALALGALAALGSAMSKPKQANYATPGPASNAANLGPTFTAALNRDVPGRQAVNPYLAGSPSYWSYGGPERTYFTGNSLRSYGLAEGGALSSAMAQEGAEGAPDGEFSTEHGQHYVQGPGDGKEDLIPARLADGEYVLDATTVSRLGNGSNRRGAEVLDRWRKKVAGAAGSKQVVQNTINPGALMRALGGAA